MITITEYGVNGKKTFSDWMSLWMFNYLGAYSLELVRIGNALNLKSVFCVFGAYF